MSKKEKVTSILENDVIAKRLKYLDRLVDENISQRTGMLLQLTIKGDLNQDQLQKLQENQVSPNFRYFPEINNFRNSQVNSQRQVSKDFNNLQTQDSLMEITKKNSHGETTVWLQPSQTKDSIMRQSYDQQSQVKHVGFLENLEDQIKFQRQSYETPKGSFMQLLKQKNQAQGIVGRSFAQFQSSDNNRQDFNISFDKIHLRQINQSLQTEGKFNKRNQPLDGQKILSTLNDSTNSMTIKKKEDNEFRNHDYQKIKPALIELRQNKEFNIQQNKVKVQKIKQESIEVIENGQLDFRQRTDPLENLKAFELQLEQALISKKSPKKSLRSKLQQIGKSVDFTLNRNSEQKFTHRKSPLLGQNSILQVNMESSNSHQKSEFELMKFKSISTKKLKEVESLQEQVRIKKHQISTGNDTNQFMSWRERKFRYDEIKSRLIKIEPINKYKQVANPLQNYLLDSAHYKYNRINDGDWGTDLNTIDIKEDPGDTSEKMKKEVKFFSEDKLKKAEQMRKKDQNMIEKLNASFSHYDSGEERSEKRQKDTDIDSFEVSMKSLKISEKKLKQEMQKTINRIEQQKERAERQQFNMSFALNDISMAPIRGIINQKTRQMTSATDNKIEMKQIVRRQGNLLKEQIQLMENQIKKMKRKIKAQAGSNQLIDKQIEQQLEIQNKLHQFYNQSPINTSALKLKERNIEEQTLVHSQGSGYVSEMQKKRIAKILKHSNSISANSQENRSAQNLLKMKSLMFQQLQDPQKQAASQTTLTNESNRNLTTIQQSSFIIGNPQNIPENNVFQTFQIEDPKQTQVDNSVLKFYKNLIEDDISINIHKLKTDVSETKEINQILASEIDYYKTENQTLKNISNRYKQMANDFTKAYDKSYESSVYSESSNRKMIQGDEEILIDQIQQEVYKYGKNAKVDLDRESHHSYFGRLASCTPITLAPMAQVTNQSFVQRNNLQIFEIKKINTINNFLMPKVFRAPKMYESIQEFLVQIKQIFKPQKLTLFMLDKDFQKTLIRGSNERKLNYRKIMVNTGMMSKQQESQITCFAIFESKNEFMLPLFKDLDEASKLIFNNKTILIPMKNKNQETLMTLQLVYDINMKVAKQQQRRGQMKTHSSFKSRPSSVQMLKFSASKQQESSDRRQSASPLLGKTFSITKKNKNRNQELQGWSINDYSILKILAQYLQMNIEIFEAVKISKQKEDKKLEFIQFAGEIATIQTYRQLIKKVETCSKQILGFDHVSLFFLDDELKEIFTITNVDVVEEMKKISGPTKYDTSFAQDLLLSQEQTVVFPSTLGITGEVFAHVGIRFQNDVNLIGKSKIGGLDDMDDSKSQQSQMSENSTKKLLKNSFRKQIQRQQTNLEQIKEDQAHKESEEQAIWFKRNTIYSVSDNQKKSQLLTPINLPTVLNEIGEVNLQSPSNKKNKIKISDSFTNESQNKSKKLKSLLEKNKIEKILSDNAFDFSNETIKAGNNKLIQPMPKKAQKNEPRYISEFLPDIDNFLGVQKIQNYVIVALREDAYNFGDESKGVMMLFNKSDRTDVKREDLERIIHLSKLIGGLSRKAKAIIDTLTMVIGVDVNKMPVLQQASKIDSTPGQGEFQQVSLCVQTIAKLLSTLSDGN